MTVQDVRALLRSREWQALESRNNQIAFLYEFAEGNTTSTLASDEVA
jgi:hypothetical protein